MFKIDSLGSDPELILLSNKTNLPTSAVGFYVDEPSIALYSDNVLLEANHPPFTPSTFSDGINDVLDKVSTHTATFKGGCHYKLGQCEAVYHTNELMSKESQEVGCEPFQSAYNIGVNSVPSPYTSNKRFAGGHIHIGYCKSKLPPHMLVQLLDEQLLSLDPNHGTTQRSSFYGAAGAYRDKPYGLEYRPLSNWWLANPGLVVDVLEDVTSYVNKKYYKV